MERQPNILISTKYGDMCNTCKFLKEATSDFPDGHKGTGANLTCDPTDGTGIMRTTTIEINKKTAEISYNYNNYNVQCPLSDKETKS